MAISSTSICRRFAQLMVPFTWVSKPVGEVVWFALTAAMAAAFVRLSLIALPDRRLSSKVLVWLTVLLTGKFFVKELAFGQFNLPVGLLLIGAVIAAQHGRGLTAGAAIAAGVFVKPYALVLVPWLARTFGWRPFVPFTLVTAVGLLLPAVTYGWDGNLTLLHEWYRTVTDTTAPNLLSADNISFSSMWAKWIGPGPLASTLALGSAVTAIAAGGAVMLRRRQVAEPNYLEAAYFCVLIPLLSPQGWDYVLLLGLPGVHVSRRSMARFVDGLARGRADGLLSHQFHDFRPAAAHALLPPRGVGCEQRWCRADCRMPHPLTLEGGRLSATAPSAGTLALDARLIVDDEDAHRVLHWC